VTTRFWERRKVFITGYTGFKGSWLSLWLHNRGAEIYGYALPPEEEGLFESARIDELTRGEFSDVCDRIALTQAVRAFSPEIVFHLAAQPLVRLSYADPVQTYATNVMGTVHLLDAVRQVNSVRSVVVVTSDKCYENREWSWPYRETDTLGGFDPYSNSKGCAELVSSAFRNSYFSPTAAPQHSALIATARAGNVIGGGDWSIDRLVPDVIRAARNGSSVQIRYPNAIRPWQHVLEPLAGYMTLGERLYNGDRSAAEAWNFGPDTTSEWPVASVVSQLCTLLGNGASWEHVGGQFLHEATYLSLDSSKTRQKLNWNPKWTTNEALSQTVGWYRSQMNGSDMRKFSLQQIADYES